MNATEPRSASGDSVANADPAKLARQFRAQFKPDQRIILGLAGPPGTGKSTFAQQLAGAMHPRIAVVVPLDGFHLGSRIITGTDLEHRKGAIDTFDAAGYATLLTRLRRRDEPVVYAPAYDRTIEEPIARSIAIDRDVQVVITEGNYLLVDDLEWARARAAMDLVWYVDTDPALRIERLIARHIRFGKTPAAARAWVIASDEINARLVVSTMNRADQVLLWN